jgi:CheY-like chemotaxis protein
MNTMSLQNKTILIVDDYPINIELLRLILEETGVRVLSASNGRECLDVVENEQVDMILMDRNMPVMNGIEATRAVRAMPHGSGIVIVGISGAEEEEEKAACLDAGMDAVTGKLTLKSDTLAEIGNRFFGQCGSIDAVSDSHSPAVSQLRGDCSTPDSSEVARVMDYDKALREFENDHELLDRLVVDFTITIQHQMDVLLKAFDENDFERIRVESHGMKGGAANLCAVRLAGAARTLEKACKETADGATIKMLLAVLSDEIRSFSDEVLAGKTP